MKRLVAALAACVFVSPASAAVIDSFTLDVGSSVGNSSTAVLSLGVDYRISVIGTFEIGCTGGSPACPADAEFYFSGGTAYDRTGFSNTPGVGSEVGAGINGLDVDWGAYQPSGVYSTIFTGLGAAVNIFYQDTNYGDNVGSLRVTIETLDGQEVPLPASLPLALSGLGLAALLRRRRPA